MIAAKTTHGNYAMSNAPKRLAQLRVRTLIVRCGLTCTATQLQAYLPAEIAARLDAAPEELKAPKHPSQVAFEALHATTPCNCLPPRLGLGRRVRARLGADGGAVDGAAMVLRGRAAARAAARAEAATQAPWRAAIVLAQEAKRAAREARRQTRNLRNNPPRVAAEAETHNPRNDPMRGVTLRARVTAGAPVDAPSEVPAGRPVGDRVACVPGSPGWGEALAREVTARRVRAESALRGNDPMRGPAAGAGAAGAGVGGGARVARKVPALGSTRGLALGSTTLAPTWAPSMAEILAAQFGPAAPEGWAGAPLGIAAMPSGDYAQRPHAGSAATGVRRRCG
jgi:hypothetical protein